MVDTDSKMLWNCKVVLSQSPQFYGEGIRHTLIMCHEKCVTFYGDFVE